MNTQQINLSEWVETYAKDLYSWAFHKVSDSELAKDLVQDTFLAATQKIATFKGDSSPKTWLMSILNYKIIDYYRKKANKPVRLDMQSFAEYFDEEGDWKTEKRPKDWHQDESQLLDDSDFRMILEKCLDALPDKWNVCIKSKYLMNKDGNEICQDLEITATNLWQIIHRAKLQLRDCVELNWFKN
ncbi:MAG: sigma-70 family RNA polymerase sigma factor [Bacteroidales bacterium]|jgi:RNA polymerase sigma-70 factor (ECF subfamily)|nr:sigma-70 family RNA polymerase sigma factor [Bacteroidales bacterium]